MTTQTYFLDSNIWLYMLLTNKNKPEEVEKQVIASQLIQTEKIIISTQVIAEVSVNLIKKGNMGEDDICTLIQDLYDTCSVIEINYNILLNSSHLRNQYMFSFWDSLIVASALFTEANILYSEDMQNSLIVLDKLQIINPFI